MLFMIALVAHNARSGLLLSASAASAMLVLSGQVVSLPQIIGGITRPVDVPLLIAVTAAPIATHVLAGDVLLLEAGAHRRLLLVDTCLVLILVLPAAAACLSAALLGDAASGLGILRNVAAFAAIAVALLAVARPATAAALPVAYLLAMATAGLGADGTPAWWAWLRADPSPGTTLLGLLLLVLAAVLFHVRARALASRTASVGTVVD